MEESQIDSNDIGQRSEEGATAPQIDAHYVESLETHDTPQGSPQENTHSDIQTPSLMQSLLTEIHELRQDFETKVQYDRDKERLIASLHGELQEYREGLHFRILKPIFTDLIIMYDDLGKLIESLIPIDTTFTQQVIQHLILFQESIEETLRRNDVDTFICEEDVFLPSRQRVLRVIPTDNLELDRHIARRVRRGFECGNRLLRPEIVETYKYIPIADQ
jgi:molecular chaperone GrpE